MFRSMSLDPPLITAISHSVYTINPRTSAQLLHVSKSQLKTSEVINLCTTCVGMVTHTMDTEQFKNAAGNISLIKQKCDVVFILMEMRREMCSPMPHGFNAKCTSTSHLAVLLPSESLQAMVLLYLFVMLKHSTNGRVRGVNCVYLHLGNRQSSLQQNTVAKFIQNGLKIQYASGRE